MDSVFRILCAIGVAISLISCGSGSEPKPAPTGSSIDLNSLQAIDLSPGVRNVSVNLTDGTEWVFQISVPNYDPGDKLPLLLGLHWAGDESTYEEYMSCLVLPAFSDFDGIIVAPSAGIDLWWEPPLRERVVEFVQLVKSYWPVDANKVVVTGYSNGGSGSWYFADEHSQEFSAAIPMAGFYTSKFEKFNIPLYIIHSDGDELFPYNYAKLKIDYAISLGSDITVKLLPDLSHYMGCSYFEYLAETQVWLNDHVWK